MTAKHTRGTARIISQTGVARGYREMKLGYSNGKTPASKPVPGSFFTILPVSHPLQTMRRPFAYSDSEEGGFSFIYEVRGDSTHDFSVLSDGSELDWIGPLGTSFPYPEPGKRPVLVTGGIGVGPICYLAHELAVRKGTPSPLVVIGARTADLIPEIRWPENAELRICTDDGSAGIHGNATAALESSDSEAAELYTCGPVPMMKALHNIALEAEIRCWVSMEEMMACGVGACQGCAVEMAERGTDGGPTYKRACVEGPIFDSRELAWEK